MIVASGPQFPNRNRKGFTLVMTKNTSSSYSRSYQRVFQWTSTKEIFNLLKAALLPKQIAVIHLHGHQRSEDQVAKRNQRADMALLPSEHPLYSPTENSQASERGYCLDHRGWWITPKSKLFLPQSSQWKVLKTLHQTYHLGVHKTLSMAGRLFEGIKLGDTLQDTIRM
jgi:hypothetical protein